MTVQGHRFIVETEDLRSVRSFRASACLPIESSDSPWATRDNSSTPRLRRIVKGGDFQKTTFEMRPDCVGPLVLAQTYSSTEEALCRRRSALSGQGVVSHDHYRVPHGTRSATAAESIRNTYQLFVHRRDLDHQRFRYQCCRRESGVAKSSFETTRPIVFVRSARIPNFSGCARK